MPSKITRVLLGVLVVVLVAGAGFGLYKYRSSFKVEKSATKAAEPREVTVSNSSPGNATILGVGISCTAREVLNQFGYTEGWDVTIVGTNLDAAKKSTGVKIHVPWGTALEGTDSASGTNRFSVSPGTITASAETFATPGYSGSLTSCTLTVPGAVSPNPPTPVGDCDELTEQDVGSAVDGTQYLGLFDRNPAQPTNTLKNGSLLLPLTLVRSADKNTLTVTLGNGTEKCLVASVGVYKMYDGVLANQKYFSGKDNITVRPGTSATYSMPLPSCTAQIDVYGAYASAPRTLAEGSYPLIGWAYHLSQSDTYRSPSGPICNDTDNPPQGNFDSADCNNFIGWALDRDVPNQTLDVHVYRDGAAGQGGVFVGSFKADKPRSDVNTQLQVSGNHGFVIPTPEVFKDGRAHTVYIYAINPVSGKVNPLLSGSPKTLTCAAPPPPPSGQCKLEITKAVNPATARPGDLIQYTIDVKNTGTADCTGGGVRIEDQYDQSLTFASESHSSNVVRGYSTTNTPFHNLSTHTLTWNANTLVPGQSAHITWSATTGQVAACASQTVTNSARVTAAEYNNMQTWVTSPVVTTVVTATCPPVQDKTDVGVTKSVSPSLITVGQTATFTVRVTNNGPLPTTKTVVSDLLPSGLALISATPSVGTYAAQSGTWDVGPLAVRQQERLTLVVRGDVTGTKVNVATVSTTEPADSDSTNNRAEATLTMVAPAIPDVVCAPTAQTITVSQAATLAAVGGTGTYSWSAPEGTPTSGSGSTFSVQFVSTGQKTVTVSSGDKRATCTVQVNSPTPPPPALLDLSVSKQVSPAVVLVGQAATFTVTVQNLTQVTAQAVQLTDAVPAGLTLVNSTASQGVYTQNTNVWSVGTLGSGAYATLTFQVTGSAAGSYTNRVDITSSTPADSNAANNTASATLLVQSPPTGPVPLVCVLSTNSVLVGQVITAYATGGVGGYAWYAAAGTPQNGTGTSFSTGFTSAGPKTIQVQSGSNTAFCSLVVTAPPVEPSGADLSLAKHITPASVYVGEHAIFSIVLSNGGPNSADMVTVRDVMPAGLAVLSATASRGSYDAKTGMWTVGLIAPGEQLTLLLTVKADHAGTYTNTAEVWTSNTPDPDSTPGNSNSSEDDQSSAVLTVKNGLVSAGVPVGPVSMLAVLCAMAGLLSIRVRTRREVRLQTPSGDVLVAFDPAE